MDVMVHSSMSSLGYVVNGAIDVIDALIKSVGQSGTILMPAHTGQLTDPFGWSSEDFSIADRLKIRDAMKPLDGKRTPSRNRGAIPQAMLAYDGAMRSMHPLNSVVGLGARSEFYTQNHDLHQSEGIDSPVGRLYAREQFVLLIGVTLARCTAIHLAEFIADVPYLESNDMTVLSNCEGGLNIFRKLEKYPGNSDGFTRLMIDYPRPSVFRKKPIFRGELILFPIKPVVDFAVRMLNENNNYFREAS